MYTKKHYGFWMTFSWSIKPFIYGVIYSTIVVFVRYGMKESFGVECAIPWEPVSIIGIAVAFYLGFKNSASYDRTWEARKIWGGIVNNSRTFTAGLLSFVEGDNRTVIIKRIVYRHVAWLTALNYQLRVKKDWEHSDSNIKSNTHPFKSDAYYAELNQILMQYLDPAEMHDYVGKVNIATQLLKKQSLELQVLYNEKYFNSFRHMELFKLLGTFYDDQGKSERIKNFPFPRQYASTALWQTVLFCMLVPFGMLSIFSDTYTKYHLIVIPFSAMITWVFFLMEQIGDYSENPFEGSFNDVPISTITRDIEIDIRQMIGDGNIPTALESKNGFLM
jgi:ion channel-forming bestrophin family protein